MLASLNIPAEPVQANRQSEKNLALGSVYLPGFRSEIGSAALQRPRDLLSKCIVHAEKMTAKTEEG